MKLFLVTAPGNTGYDEYDAIIVAAENEEDAKTVKELDPTGYDDGTWVMLVDELSVELLGTAKAGTKRGIILGSFNAG